MKKTVNKSQKRTKKLVVRKTKKRTTKKRRIFSRILVKFTENPIISPQRRNDWEAWQTFNPGAALIDDKVHFLYRAVGTDGVSRLGYAASEDGFRVSERSSLPVYTHKTGNRDFSYYSFASGGSFGGAEDPRIVRVNDEDTLYMTYTACDNGLRVGLTSIEKEDFLQKKWNWTPPRLISSPGELHKNWVIFPEKINNKYAILHSMNPEILIAYRDNLKFNEGEYIESYYGGVRRKDCWDTCVRGVGAPPIKTKYGWLLFYHAIDEEDPGKYKVGAMLLDISNPTKILHRSPEPILEPEEYYEHNGFKGGVVYVSGAVVKNGELLVYYGAADSYVSVACAPLQEFLKALIKEATPKLKTKPLM